MLFNLTELSYVRYPLQSLRLHNFQSVGSVSGDFFFVY